VGGERKKKDMVRKIGCLARRCMAGREFGGKGWWVYGPLSKVLWRLNLSYDSVLTYPRGGKKKGGGHQEEGIRRPTDD